MRRGEIYHCDLEPSEGREQRGDRRVLIISDDAFNRSFLPVIVPITRGGNYARERGFTVSLANLGLNTDGVVLCNYPRAIDLNSRRANFVEMAPQDVVDDVLSKVMAIFE